MKNRFHLASLAFAAAVLSAAAMPSRGQTPTQAPDQTTTKTAPAAVTPPTPMTPDIVHGFDPTPADADYIKRVVMVPMHDGVKLYTVIVMKKGTENGPLLLSRTPYDAKKTTQRTPSPSITEILPVMDAEFAEDGYIRVYQDIRGEHHSEG